MYYIFIDSSLWQPGNALFLQMTLIHSGTFICVCKYACMRTHTHIHIRM